MSKIAELRAERLKLGLRMREIIDAADAEGREFTAEEQTEHDRLEADFDRLGAQAAREEKQLAREAELGRSAGAFDARATQTNDNSVSEVEERVKAYEGVFGKYIRRRDLDRDEVRLLNLGRVDARDIDWGLADSETRDQAKGTNTSGGYLVPVAFQRQMQEYLVQAGTVRQLESAPGNGPTTLVTGSGENLQWPKVTAHGAASWYGEAGTFTSNDETFGQITFQAYKAGRIVKVSEELLDDNAVDLEGFLARELGRSIGALENHAYIQGTGSGQPTGILTEIVNASTTVVTTASPTAVTADELISLFYQVNPQYRRNGQWMFGDGAIQAIRKLKDSYGRYLIDIAGGSGGLGGGTGGAAGVDTLLGKPVWDDPDVPAFGTATNKFGIFGDWGSYGIRDVGTAGPLAPEKGVAGFAVRRLDERYADTMEVGFLAFHRTDGRLIDTTNTAITYIAHHS